MTDIAFITPSRNISCIFMPASNDEGLRLSDRLYCLRQEPRLIVGVLDKNGASSGPTYGDQPFNLELSTLKYGDNWFYKGFSCDSSRAGIVCSHSTYGAFQLSRKGFKKLR